MKSESEGERGECEGKGGGVVTRGKAGNGSGVIDRGGLDYRGAYPSSDRLRLQMASPDSKLLQ